ncbi:MAG: hypothetical protein U9R52_03715 [Candidatus Omnitrophota bacterium]|nr:hypothetical protein [Candidatus Omnitrophota bacterium]
MNKIKSLMTSPLTRAILGLYFACNFHTYVGNKLMTFTASLIMVIAIFSLVVEIWHLKTELAVRDRTIKSLGEAKVKSEKL